MLAVQKECRWLVVVTALGVMSGCGQKPAAPEAAAPTAAPITIVEDDPPVYEPEPVLTSELIVDEPHPTPAGMKWIPGGTFTMGTDNPRFPDETPAHEVTLDGFWIDETEVTNAQFQKFVDATGYVTIAEKAPKREDFAGQVENVADIPAENLVAGSICFNSMFDPNTLRKDGPLWPYQVWQYVPGANWKQPEGPSSSLEGRWEHPVVHVSWNDAMAYCRWAGKRLPTGSGMGTRGPRRTRRGRISVGQLSAPGREVDEQHLAGGVPSRERERGRSCAGRPGQIVPAERLRALRHVGQRVGVVLRLVPAGLLHRQPGTQSTGSPRESRSE